MFSNIGTWVVIALVVAGFGLGMHLRADAAIPRTAEEMNRTVAVIEQRIAAQNPALSEYARREVAASITVFATFEEVDPLLIAAVVEVESHYRADAVGEAGERGLMQIMEGTAADLGLDWTQAFDVEQNVDAGTRYLARHIRQYGDVRRALIRYNGAAVYADKVLAVYEELRALYNEATINALNGV